MKRESRVSKVDRGDAGEPNVDCFCLHVKTVLGNTRGMSPQEFVAPGRTVAADDRDLGVGLADGGSEVRKEIKEMRIVAKLISSAVVTQKVIEFGNRVLEINVATPVNDVDALARMGVE
jgi:hypothetical protein